MALLLPYYGAEAYGLNGLARFALEHGTPDPVHAESIVRNSPLQATLFILGLALAGAGGVGWVLSRRTTGGGDDASPTRAFRAGFTVSGVCAMLAAALIALYLPQFFTPPSVRITHGILLGAALRAVALAPVSRLEADEGTSRRNPS